MVAKSVIEIDVQDEKWRDFNAHFNKYKDALKELPGEWGDQEIHARALGGALSAMVSQEHKVSQELKEQTKQENIQEQIAKKRVKHWKDIQKSSWHFAMNVLGATKNLLKWGSVTVLGGALGVGLGVFGINRLAGATSGNYRQAQGQGTTTGQAKSFGVNFDRYVDSNSYLSSVNEALHDQTKRWTLLAAGLREDQIKNRDTAAVAADLLPLLKQRFAQGGNTLQGAQAYGLTQFAGLEDLTRLSKTSDKELSASRSQYDQDANKLALSDETQKKWQDFNSQLDRARETIEKVFVDTLTPLVEPFTRLSQGVAEALKSAFGDPKFKQWLDNAGEGIKTFASYLGSEEFRTSVSRFISAVGALGSGLYKIMKAFGWVDAEKPSGATPTRTTKQATGAYEDFINFASGLMVGGRGSYPVEQPKGGSTGNTGASTSQSAPVSERNNNPGNLRKWGANPVVDGFAKFKSPEEGLQAMAVQLKLYQKRDHLDTVRDLISKWAPKTENDTEGYINFVSKQIGKGSKEKLNLQDPALISNLVYAITKRENSRSNFTKESVSQALGFSSGMLQQPVIIQINNNTGGSATVSTSQLAH